MFTTPTFNKFRNREFIQYLNDIKQIVNRRDPRVLKVVPQAYVLNEQLTALENVYKNQLGSTITQELEALDKRRDLAIIGIRAVAEGNTNHFDPAKRAAGEELLKSIDKYGSPICRQNYLAETVTIQNLTNDWHSVLILQGALAILGLTDWAGELKESNDAFNRKYLERNEEYVVDSKVNVTELRDKAKESFILLIDHITAHGTLTLLEKYAVVVKEINTITEQYNTMVAKRGSTKINLVDINVKEEVIQE